MSATFRPDLVINIAPTLASAPAAWIYSRLSKAKCWLHIQDFEVDAAMQMGIVRVGRLTRITHAVEKWLLRRFDRVSTISEGMLHRLGEKGVEESRQILFPNWADVGSVRPLDGPSAYRKELDIPAESIVALYSGNMGLKQGLELLASAAQLLQQEATLFFVFGGDGPGRAALELACEGLPNVRFVGIQPRERFCEWLGLADVHLLPQRADVADLVMPSKLTGMLASGRPTLATAPSGSSVWRALLEAGVVTEPGSAVQFAEALMDLASSPDRRKVLGAAARRQAVQTLSADVIMCKFQQSMLALTPPKGLPPSLPPDVPSILESGAGRD